MNILVVAAHPDDEVLGCGGTIARMGQEGHDVFVAILGEGITSRSATGQTAQQEKLEALKKECLTAAEILAVQETFFFNHPDNKFDTVPLLQIIKDVEAVVQKTQPQIVYTHHGGDLNIDHAITARAVMTATRPVKGCAVKELYSFEIPSSTEWSFDQLASPFSPNVFYDISATLEKKIQAMQSYGTELQTPPHPRSLAILEALARKRGSAVGCDYAEAFAAVRILN